MKNNVFGKTLKQLRIEQGLSQRLLGEKLGFCNQTVSFWESGQREPDLDSLVKISNFFDVSIDFLLGKSEC
ncbi:MAG: helix-turn-helix domain-containing protein [Clostridia bacterium]|nr:helix-turn-helix domain-containing protein [Clostridia bacterium]